MIVSCSDDDSQPNPSGCNLFRYHKRQPAPAQIRRSCRRVGKPIFRPMNSLDSLPTVIGIAAVAPALLVLWMVVAADERPGPPAMVWASFLLGAASISLLGLARAFFAAIPALAAD